MRKKRWIGSIMTGILSVGIIGGMGASAVAAPKELDKEKLGVSQASERLTQVNLDSLINELKALGIHPPSHNNKAAYWASLDEATKQKIEAIRAKVKPIQLTPAEALELRKQRVTVPKKEASKEKHTTIDEITKAKALDIVNKLKAGTITKDEAIAELKKLGVPLPNLENIVNQKHDKIRPPRL